MAWIVLICRLRPDPDNARVYARLLPLFLALPQRLGAEYATMAEFQRGAQGEAVDRT
ncbi:MAG: hypothetical protein R3310_14910 [Candidatus Competibacteraceae bacterium]|nr:hypothetical protein [Candidatus Competibacteraceae bacterium]